MSLIVPRFAPEHVVFFDYETYFDRDYSLKKMTTASYVRDERFETLCVGVKIDGAEAVLMEHEEFGDWASSWDWNTTALGAHNCLPGDVEVLTRNGWVSIAEASIEQEIMQWSPRNGHLSWAKPSHKTEAEVGLMLKWDTNFHRCSYTPNHRMYFNTPSVEAWRAGPVSRVSRMHPNSVYIPTGGTFYSSEEIVLSVGEARLMEAIRADGSWVKKPGKPASGVRFRFSKKRKMDRLKLLTDKVGLELLERPASDKKEVQTFRLRASPIVDRIYRLLGDSKEYGRWVVDLPVRCREAILEEAKYWDGSSTGTRRSYHWSCVDGSTVEAFQLLAHLTGWTLSGSWVNNQRGYGVNNTGAKLYVATICEKAKVKLVERPVAELGAQTVYCFTVPDEAFLVRSKGNVFVTGNSRFESAVSAHYYGIYPGFWFDTLSMARALGFENVSLKFLMDYFRVGQKGGELENMRGKRRADFTEAEFAAAGVYCLGDTEGCAAIFEKMAPDFPESELHLIDTTIRMYSEPQLYLDEPMLQAYMVEEKQRKADLLAQCGLDRKSVGSNEKFAAALRELGVDPPRKISPTTREEVYAFAKSDVGMMALLEHETDEVRWLAEARLAVKSTINESRGGRFLELGKNGYGMCVGLNYYAAHTGRWGGSEKTNFQNLERTNKKDPKKGRLKKSLLAPPGHKVVAVDSGAIEARGVAWLSEHKTMVEAFAQNRDVYSDFASEIYGRPIDRKARAEDEVPGFIAKTCVLGLGYSQGGAKLGENFLKGVSGPPVQFTTTEVETLGVDLDKFMQDERKVKAVEKMISRLDIEARIIHCAVADHLVKKYRTTNKPIPQCWKFMGDVIRAMDEGIEGYFGPNDCLQTVKNGIILPNGLKLHYPELRQSKRGDFENEIEDEEDDQDAWRRKGYSYFNGQNRTRLYGGLLLENCCQALARIVVAEQMLHVRAMTGYRPVMGAHDEWTYVVPDSDAHALKSFVIETMKVAPTWANGWPLNAEGGVGASYGEAK